MNDGSAVFGFFSAFFFGSTAEKLLDLLDPNKKKENKKLDTTVSHQALQTGLSSSRSLIIAQSNSLEDRIAADYSNMLKLSESGKITFENGIPQTKCISNFYFDTTGNLTVGYGSNLDSNPELIRELEIVDRNGRLLNEAEKYSYLARVKAQYKAMGSPKNMADGKYANLPVFNECRITERSAERAMQTEIKSHFKELAEDFRRHGVDPNKIDHSMLKLALDIKYNVGGTFSKKYPTLFRKIATGNYEAIEPKDYRCCTSKTDRSRVNVAREAMKASLVAQAQDLSAAMRANPLPANATSEQIAAYKQNLFTALAKQEAVRTSNLQNGQILLPDALRSLSLSIDSRLNGILPLSSVQMAQSVTFADQLALALFGNSSLISTLRNNAQSYTDMNTLAIQNNGYGLV